MVMLRDTVVQECIQFLEHCEGEQPSQTRLQKYLNTINGITLFLQIKMFVYGSQFLVIVNVLVIV